MAKGETTAAKKAVPLYPLPVALGLTLLALAATGCGLTPSHTPRASAQWSNGKLVGLAALNNPVAFQMDEAGNGLMVWVGLEHELHFARLNEQAEVVVQRPLHLPTHSPLKPQLLRDTTGQLHLTWLDRQDRALQLLYARLSPDGEVIQEATALAPSEGRVAHSAMVLDPMGQTVELFWSDNVPIRSGCYHLALDWSGAVVVPVELLIPDGILPAGQIDRLGLVHLAWKVEPEASKPQFRYAVYDPQRRALGPDTGVSEPLVEAAMIGRPTAGVSFDGPWLGLDESWVYLAWVLEVREQGEVMDFTFYQSFLQPAFGQRQAAATFDYLPPAVTAEAVQLRGISPTLTGHPRFLEGQPMQQVLAYFTQVAGPANVETLQIGITALQAGQIKGQEIVNASRGASLRPSVAVDSQGQHHLVWIDTAGFERYQVVYASTSARARQTLNRITTYEIVDRVLGVVMGILTALFFVPLVFSWVLIPIGWLVLFTLSTHESEMSDPGGSRAVGLAMALHLGAKLLFFPDLPTRFPFSSLVSPSLALLLARWVLPLLLAAASAGLVWSCVRRGRSQSIFAAYFVYAAADSFLTLVIYLVPLMGYL